ncbi:MAG: hypothetical protein ACRDZO_19040 [Egibacteraceae bacterium]
MTGLLSALATRKCSWTSNSIEPGTDFAEAIARHGFLPRTGDYLSDGCRKFDPSSPDDEVLVSNI